MLSANTLDSELIPIALRPMQFEVLWRGRSTTSPERRLLISMIEQAAADLRLYRNRRNRRSKRLYAEARDWIASDDRSHAFTFVSVCDFLGMSPSALRAALLERPADAGTGCWESAA